MKKYLQIILGLLAIKLVIHLVGNRNYGFHRDELLHLSVGHHLDFGYMEFPPLIAWIGRFAEIIFGDSISGIRLFATAAGMLILILCCLMAAEFGGKKHAVLTAGVSILAFLPYFRNHCLFQPVAFDQLFWTLGFYFLVKYINTENKKFLIFMGIAAGFGLMNKYTFAVWGIGIIAGLAFYKNGKLFKNKWLYLSGLIAFLIFLPNIIWEFQHDFPIFKHLEALKKSQLDEIGPFDFLLEQIKHPFTFILGFIGLLSFFLDSHLKKYRNIGVSVLVIFGVMWISQSKGYYFFAIYPVLFAAGAVKVAQLLHRNPKWNYAVIFVLIAPVVYFIPKAIPILPIDAFVRYSDLKPDENGRYELTSDYADMFGWEEQVKLVDSIYKSLPENDRKNCIILASNYGEAGAIEVLGRKYGLPNPVCANGSFWLWGTGKTNGETIITIDIDKDVLEKTYNARQFVKRITHKYAAEEENNIDIYICRNPKISLKKVWPKLESRVFD